MKRTTTLLLAAAGGALLWRRARRSADDPDGGVLDADEARALYDRLAPVYDGVAAPTRSAPGGSTTAPSGARLRPGDTAVSLARDRPEPRPLARAVGLTGRVVGVDLSAAMLAQARDRVRRLGLDNELVRADVRELAFPKGWTGSSPCSRSRWSRTTTPSSSGPSPRSGPAGGSPSPGSAGPTDGPSGPSGSASSSTGRSG